MTDDSINQMARSIWTRFGSCLMRVARRKLGDGRRVADEEDVVISAFNSFCERAAAGKIERLDDRDDLWPLLKLITERKAIDLLHREGRQKRGGGRVRGESALDAGAEPGRRGLENLAGDRRSPSSIAQATELFERLLEILPDDTFRAITIYKMEGRTNPEIAGLLELSRATIVRKLDVIRAVWQSLLDEGSTES